MEKSGINVSGLYAEPKIPASTCWTLSQQMSVMEQRRYKTAFAKKNAMVQRIRQKKQKLIAQAPQN